MNWLLLLPAAALLACGSPPERIAPPTPHAAASPVTTALQHLDEHRFAEAADEARLAIARSPQDSTGHLLLGDALLELGRYDAATEAYQSALDLRPDLRSYARASTMRWLYGDVEGALDLMRLAIQSGREPASLAWCLAELSTMLWHAGRSRTALAAADRALAVAPGHPRAQLARARALDQAGDALAAVAAYETAIARRRDPVALLELADLLRRSDRPTDADARVREAERLAPDEPGALALHYARHGVLTEQALFLAESGLREHATIESHAAHALALWRAGQIDQARRASDRALRLGTQDARFHLHRALIERDAGDANRSQHHAEHAFRLNPRVDPLLAGELRASL